MGISDLRYDGGTSAGHSSASTTTAKVPFDDLVFAFGSVSIKMLLPVSFSDVIPEINTPASFLPLSFVL